MSNRGKNNRAGGKAAVLIKKPVAKKGPFVHSQDNAAVILTCCSPLEQSRCLPTIDAHDRAHQTFDRTSGQLVPAAEHGRLERTVPSKARRYHPSQAIRVYAARDRSYLGIIGADSMFDQWAQARRELENAGIQLGGSGSAAFSEGSLAMRALNAVLSEDVSLRDILSPRTKVRFRPDPASVNEDRLEAEASKIISEGKKL